MKKQEGKPIKATFSREDFQDICDTLGRVDHDLQEIIRAFGYPPMWARANTFETLIHFILEQQVSLSSALAALNKLREKVVEITPVNILKLTDGELKACYFSRQKTIYARHLAEMITAGQLNLQALKTLSNDEIRKKLIAVKGIGNWTVDVYLMFVLQRSDIFPIGDLAAVNALKSIKALPSDTGQNILAKVASVWEPYRTVATMLLWHYYLSSLKKVNKAPAI